MRVVPCSAPIRGKTDAAFPPAPGQPDPCGKLVAVTVDGVDHTADSLCLFHLAMKIGLKEISAPVVFA